MTFPIATAAAARLVEVEKAGGWISAASSFGSAAGALLAGLMLEPLLGLTGSALAGAAINCSAAALAAAASVTAAEPSADPLPGALARAPRRTTAPTAPPRDTARRSRARCDTPCPNDSCRSRNSYPTGAGAERRAMRHEPAEVTRGAGTTLLVVALPARRAAVVPEVLDALACVAVRHELRGVRKPDAVACVARSPGCGSRRSRSRSRAPRRSRSSPRCDPRPQARCRLCGSRHSRRAHRYRRGSADTAASRWWLIPLLRRSSDGSRGTRPLVQAARRATS